MQKYAAPLYLSGPSSYLLVRKINKNRIFHIFICVQSKTSQCGTAITLTHSTDQDHGIA